METTISTYRTNLHVSEDKKRYAQILEIRGKIPTYLTNLHVSTDKKDTRRYSRYAETTISTYHTNLHVLEDKKRYAQILEIRGKKSPRIARIFTYQKTKKDTSRYSRYAEKNLHVSHGSSRIRRQKKIRADTRDTRKKISTYRTNLHVSEDKKRYAQILEIRGKKSPRIARIFTYQKTKKDTRRYSRYVETTISTYYTDLHVSEDKKRYAQILEIRGNRVFS